ncbi:hypothetical protein HUJ04_007180 [Dendroctonus ponderosae]|nr:hypothetical protein HUJ04_007180 [Dendroctonus ponderosae]
MCSFGASSGSENISKDTKLSLLQGQLQTADKNVVLGIFNRLKLKKYKLNYIGSPVFLIKKKTEFKLLFIDAKHDYLKGEENNSCELKGAE